MVDSLARDATGITGRDQSCGSSGGWNRMVCLVGVEIIIRFDRVGRRCVRSVGCERPSLFPWSEIWAGCVEARSCGLGSWKGVGRGRVSGESGGRSGRCCARSWARCRTFAWIVRRGNGGGFTCGPGRRVVERAWCWEVRVGHLHRGDCPRLTAIACNNSFVVICTFVIVIVSVENGKRVVVSRQSLMYTWAITDRSGCQDVV
jgi:hypothetical protein